MASRCPDCGLDLDRFGPRHRCITGKLAGERKATKLEADKIAKGEMSPADLLPKEKPLASTPLVAGRLARLPAPARQPQPTTADLMAAIEGLRTQFEKLAAVVMPRTDA